MEKIAQYIYYVQINLFSLIDWMRMILLFIASRNAIELTTVPHTQAG